MTKREILIAKITYHARLGDIKEAMRLYIENKCISYATYQNAINTISKKDNK